MKYPDQPDLTDQVRASLDVLSKNDKGFVLMVESGRIDKYSHSLDWERAVYDTIMLDNFTLDQLRAGVQQVAGRALVEASGSVSLETVGDIARTGVDIISVGALTHSVRSLDLGLDFRVDAVL